MGIVSSVQVTPNFFYQFNGVTKTIVSFTLIKVNPIYRGTAK